ncbi:MAG TPA: sulfite exporter TauE/SafE family protein, partial [bacterium]|nr:sulfite exporter TauE/SafE family protein [bacterium]
MQENPKMIKSMFLSQISDMNFSNIGKTGWLKSAALLFVFLKAVALLVVLIIVLAGLFSGSQSGQKGVGLFGFLDYEILGSITYQEALNLVLFGFLSGAVGGMLGMGGGVLKVVNLHFFLAFDILFARVVSLLSYTVISLSAFWRYRKYDLIIWDIVKMLVPSSILGVLLGVIIGSWINKDLVEIILGIYALFAGIVVLNQILAKATEKEIKDIPIS